MIKKLSTYIRAICMLLLGIGNMTLTTYLSESAQTLFFPGLYGSLGSSKETGWLKEQTAAFFPCFGYLLKIENQAGETEDAGTLAMLLKEQGQEKEPEAAEEEAYRASSSNIKTDLSLEKLQDFSYLLGTFYTVDSTTTIGEEELSAERFLSKDMRIDSEMDGPKILVFHTHSQEAFADSVEGDLSTGIVGVGAYLAEQLNRRGMETLHHEGIYDLIDGKLDRSRAYELAEIGVKKILTENPTIEVLIDLHRDGVSEDVRLTTMVNGKETAKIMFFNGLSRTKTSGDIAYLYNPYIQENLAFSFQMQLACESTYPGFARRIYLKGYRYSLHMMPKSLLIEAGAQTNTLEEMRNAMDLLADVLEEVLAPEG